MEGTDGECLSRENQRSRRRTPTHETGIPYPEITGGEISPPLNCNRARFRHGIAEGNTDHKGEQKVDRQLCRHAQHDQLGLFAMRFLLLRIMPVSGGEPKTLATLFGGQGTMNVPSCSPESKRIAFVSHRLLAPSHPYATNVNSLLCEWAHAIVRRRSFTGTSKNDRLFAFACCTFCT